MKNYFLGLAAIVFAVIVVSFTTQSANSSQFDDIFFEYNPPSGTSYTEANVEDPAKYSEVSDLTTGCNNQNRKACRIRVTNLSVVQGTAPNRTLKTGAGAAVIVGAEYATDQFYVVGAAGDVAEARNKQ